MQDYGGYIAQLVEQLPEGELFTSEAVARALSQNFDIPPAHAKVVTNNQLKRMADGKRIDRIQKGVYFKAKQTVFGKTRPNLDRYAVQLLTTQGQHVIGYVSGAAYMNQIGLTSLIPRDIEIVSNQYRRTLPEGCHVSAKRPAVPVNNGNYKYLQLLDAIESLTTEHIDAENPNELIRAAARGEKIEPLELIIHARQHYSMKTLLQTVDIFAEGRNETARR